MLSSCVTSSVKYTVGAVASKLATTLISAAFFVTVADTLPAASVCFTQIEFTAYVAAGKTKRLPEPVFQVVPPFKLYCHVAFVSSPETLIVPLFVMLSLLLAPESTANANVGAAGAVVSGVVFVTAWLLNDATSLPISSWIACASLLDVGSV